MQTFCLVINNVLSIVINIQNTTIFEPVILTGFYTIVSIEKHSLLQDSQDKDLMLLSTLVL